MNINVLGVELECDFFDADQMEVYERENRRVAEDIKEPTQYENKSVADAYRIQCGIVDRFFDAVFGDGTAKRIFHGKANLRDHMEAFGIVAQASGEARAEFDAIEEKYAPNRAERRQSERENRQAQKQGSRNFQHYAAGSKNGKKHKN